MAASRKQITSALAAHPLDAELRLLLASIFRETERFDQATASLDDLELLDSAVIWQEEISRERVRIAESQETQGAPNEVVVDNPSHADSDVTVRTTDKIEDQHAHPPNEWAIAASQADHHRAGERRQAQLSEQQKVPEPDFRVEQEVSTPALSATNSEAIRPSTEKRLEEPENTNYVSRYADSSSHDELSREVENQQGKSTSEAMSQQVLNQQHEKLPRNRQEKSSQKDNEDSSPLNRQPTSRKAA